MGAADDDVTTVDRHIQLLGTERRDVHVHAKVILVRSDLNKENLQSLDRLQNPVSLCYRIESLDLKVSSQEKLIEAWEASYPRRYDRIIIG